MRVWAQVNLACLIFLTFHAFTGTNAVAAGKPRALLIGINEYQSETITDLRGAVNDISKMRQVLIDRYGFTEDSIQFLTDTAATRSAILAALDQLVQAAGPDDSIYVHFSGHGSQVTDVNGDEQGDLMDETIIPYDGRTEGVADITDDELAQFVSRLQSRYTLIVLDSCHSGTATRDVTVRSRAVAPDDRVALYPNVSRRELVALTESNYVLMTGAASHQSALDGPVDEDNTFYGLFSYALGTSMANAPAGASPKQIHEGVQRVFQRLQARLGGIAMPEPQFEASAELLDQPLFGRTIEVDADDVEASAPPFVRVEQLDSDRVVLIAAAHMDAEPGSIWAIYPPDETEFGPGGALVTAVVDGLSEGNAMAKLTAAVDIAQGCRSVLIAGSAGSRAIAVRLDRISANRALLETALIRVLPAIEIVGEDEYARFIVDVVDGKCNVYGLGGLQLLQSFEMVTEEQAAAKLAVIFQRSFNASSLLGLHNPSSQLTLEVAVASPLNSPARGFSTVASGQAPSYRFRQQGEIRNATNSLMVEVVASRECYITIIDVDTEGGINLLFPNDYQSSDFYPDGLIPAEQPVRVPDSLENGQAGFFWDCGPPAGVETIQVFATTDLEAAVVIREYITQLSTSAGSTRSMSERSIGGDPDPFNALRMKLAGRWASRGFNVVADESETTAQPENAESVSDWTTASITVLVEK